MKVLIVGSGGREHAIAYKLSKSSIVSKIYCAPGNGGIENVAECVDIKVDDISALKEFAKENQISLTIVGPELPLVMGIVDEFEKEGLKIFGPNKKCAAFEGSKALTKEFLYKYNIPTAKYFEVDTYEDALDKLKEFTSYPVVIKADGLAAGKGVIIAKDEKMAISTLKDMMLDKVFGSAGDKVVIEEFLRGTEASILCFVDGKTIIPMESARDYKAIYDNDEGPNTGGMGTFSPNILLNSKINKNIDEEVIRPIMDGFLKENLDYKGILFIGVMIDGEKPKVLEFNVRFGDPETQSILLRLESDLAVIMLNVTDGILKEEDIVWSKDESVCVVLSSGGYPDKYENGKLIKGLDLVDENCLVFHAGTSKKDDKLYTNGGRVLGVCAKAKSIDEAREIVYKNINKIDFEGVFYRSDIARI